MRPPGFEPGISGLEGPLRDAKRRKTALVANLRQYATNGNVKAFIEYLINERRISEDTVKEYVSAINKPFHETRNAQKAYRLFARFLSSRGVISDDFANKILSVVKVSRTNADIKVPTEDEVKKALEITKEREDIYLIYRLALESGSRLSEILNVLKEPEKDVNENEIRYYPLSWTRGYKGSFYIFHITPLKPVNVSRDIVTHFAMKHDIIPIKYIRKFVATKMAELSIPLDIIDFIQGRKPTRVLTQHYVSLFGIAKEHYRKYAEWLSKL